MHDAEAQRGASFDAEDAAAAAVHEITQDVATPWSATRYTLQIKPSNHSPYYAKQPLFILCLATTLHMPSNHSTCFA